MRAARIGATSGAGDEPLSPELVLVDPLLAVRARTQLADFPVVERPRPAEQSDEADEAAAPTPAPAASPWLSTVWLEASLAEDPPPSPGAAVRSRRLALALVVALFVCSLGLVLFGSPLLDETGSSAREQAVSPAPAPAPAETVRHTAPKAPGPTQVAPTPASSVFVWVADARASHYKVEFFRSGTKIFEAFPARPRIVLPGRWVYRGRSFALTPGSYRWTVRPGYGRRAQNDYGSTIVRSTWVLPS